MGIIHRDLKPPNIIYDPSKPAFSRVNFIDCDRMIPVNAADPQDISGTPGWMAPEMEARYSGDKEDPATWCVPHDIRHCARLLLEGGRGGDLLSIVRDRRLTGVTPG